MSVASPHLSKTPFWSQTAEMIKERLKGITHKKFMEDNATFNVACEAAGIVPTKRQAAKFRSKRGLAYKA